MLPNEAFCDRQPLKETKNKSSKFICHSHGILNLKKESFDSHNHLILIGVFCRLVKMSQTESNKTFVNISLMKKSR